MFEAMERGELRALYVIGENPAQSEADAHRAAQLLEGLDLLVVQDIFLTSDRRARRRRAARRGRAGASREGTVTNSERRVQRVRKALEPPGEARDDLAILVRPRRAGSATTGATPTPRTVWDELRSLSPMHAGHELRAARGARRHPVAVLRRGPSRRAVPARPAVGATRSTGPRAPFHAVEHEPPVDELTDEFPLRLTTGRRLDSYNTGVQTGGYTLAAAPAARRSTSRPRTPTRSGVAEGERVRVVLARGERGRAGAHRPRRCARASRS